MRRMINEELAAVYEKAICCTKLLFKDNACDHDVGYTLRGLEDELTGSGT